MPLAEVRRAAGYWPPAATATAKKGGEGERPGKSEVVLREADFVALFLKYKDLSARRKREFDRIFEMIDRELDHTKRADES